MNAHERSRAFDPEEGATVLDVFAPLRLALDHCRSDEPGPRRRLLERARMVLVGAAALGVGVALAMLQARPSSRVEAAPPPVAVGPVTVAALEEVGEPEPRPAPIAAHRRAPAPATVLAGFNRRALGAYARGQLDPAVRLLSQGLRLCRPPAPSLREPCALTHANLAVVLEGGFGQTGLAARHLRAAQELRAPSLERTAQGPL